MRRGMADRDQEVRFVIKRGSLDHKTDLIKSTKGTLFMPTSSRLRVRRFDFARDFEWRQFLSFRVVDVTVTLF